MPIVQVNGLTKVFGSTKAVDGISFSIGEGRCAALLGPNGAGKTTTIRILTGLLAPTAGNIQFSIVASEADIRPVIGYLSQIPAFYGWMSGKEFLQLAAQLHGLSAAEARKRSDVLLERLGLAGAGRRRIAGYSGGMKQRLGLAQALVQLALGVAAALMIVSPLFPDAMTWSPGLLPGAAGLAAVSGSWDADVLKYAAMTFTLTGLILCTSMLAIRKRPSPDL